MQQNALGQVRAKADKDQGDTKSNLGAVEVQRLIRPQVLRG